MDVTQAEATEMTRKLAREEGIFAGMSSGGAASAAIRLSGELSSGLLFLLPATAATGILAAICLGKVLNSYFQILGGYFCVPQFGGDPIECVDLFVSH